MATQGYFRLEHSSVNRSRSKAFPNRAYGDGYLANKANYAANTNKCAWIRTINMGVTRDEVGNTIRQNEKELTRKNAVLGDALIVSLPVELSETHREEAALRYLWAITGEGRGKASAFYHTDHEHNPHLHIILIDRDVDTGKPVLKLHSNRTIRAKLGVTSNSTEWLRETWERECNSVLEEYGYDIRIDRRSNLERGLEAPGQHRGYDNDNHVRGVTKMISEHSPEETEEAREGDTDMVGTIEREPDERVSLAANDIRLITVTRREQEYLKQARSRIEQAKAHYLSLVQKRDQASFERDIYATSSAKLLDKAQETEHTLQQYTRADGTLKGHGFKIGGFKLLGITIPEQRFATQTRIEAEAAQAEYERINPAAEVVRDKLRAKEEAISSLDAQATVAEREAYMRHKELERIYCCTHNEAVTEEEVQRILDRADRTFQGTISKAARNVPLEAAREAFLSVETTEDEYEAYLIEAGHQDELRHFYENRAEYQIVEVPDEEEEEGL